MIGYVSRKIEMQMRNMKRFLFCFILISPLDTSFATNFFEKIKNTAEIKQTYLEHNKNNFVVTSKGRLYFKSAPDEKCEMKNVFLIPGDQVIGYTEYNGFISVAYFKKNGDSVDGWLDAMWLKNTGQTNGPSSEEQMVFNMIPEIIAKNKLSSLKNNCLQYSMNSNDEKYYTITITTAPGRNCNNEKTLPFTVLIKKGNLEAYTNQGNKNDEFRMITAH